MTKNDTTLIRNVSAYALGIAIMGASILAMVIGETSILFPLHVVASVVGASALALGCIGMIVVVGEVFNAR